MSTSLCLRLACARRGEFLKAFARRVHIVDVILQLELSDVIVTEDDVRVLGLELLLERHELRVQAELKDMLWLCRACEFSVCYFVGMSTKRGRTLDAQQEIRVAMPGNVGESALVDHVDAVAHRLTSRAGHFVQRIGARNLADRLSLAP